MEVVAGRVAGGADPPDYLTLYNGIPHGYQTGTHVTVHCPASVGVRNSNVVSVGRAVGGHHHCPALCRQDIRSVGRGEVYSAVQLPSVIRAVTISKGRGNAGVSRQGPDIVPISDGGELVAEGIVLEDNGNIFCTAIAFPSQLLRHHLRKFNGVGFGIAAILVQRPRNITVSE